MEPDEKPIVVYKYKTTVAEAGRILLPGTEWTFVLEGINTKFVVTDDLPFVVGDHVTITITKEPKPDAQPQGPSL
jgi:hypothetical protein